MSTTVTSSAPTSPRALLTSFVAHLNAGSLDALVALYDPAAIFVTGGVVHRGREAIGRALAELLALRPTMQTEVREIHEEGDIALAVVSWSLRGTAPDGTAVAQEGLSADVLRRLPDGTWRVSIDHP